VTLSAIGCEPPAYSVQGQQRAPTAVGDRCPAHLLLRGAKLIRQERR